MKLSAEKTPSVRGRPQDADGHATRLRIIDAARDCFSRHGYANATNRMIAAAAGVTASALYNYFPTKADLYAAVVEVGEQQVADAYGQVIANIDSPLEAICAILDFNIGVHGAEPERALFYGHLRSEIGRHTELASRLQNRVSPTENIVRSLLQEARRRGEISDAIPQENVEMMLFACMLGMSAYGLQVDKEQQQINMRAFRMLIDGTLIRRA